MKKSGLSCVMVLALGIILIAGCKVQGVLADGGNAESGIFYSITVEAESVERVTPSLGQAKAGETVTLVIAEGTDLIQNITVTATADTEEGEEVKVKVDVDQTGNPSVYTFRMPANDVVVSAEFSPKPSDKSKRDGRYPMPNGLSIFPWVKEIP